MRFVQEAYVANFVLIIVFDFLCSASSQALDTARATLYPLTTWQKVRMLAFITPQFFRERLKLSVRVVLSLHYARLCSTELTTTRRRVYDMMNVSSPQSTRSGAGYLSRAAGLTRSAHLVGCAWSQIFVAIGIVSRGRKSLYTINGREGIPGALFTVHFSTCTCTYTLDDSQDVILGTMQFSHFCCPSFTVGVTF